MIVIWNEAKPKEVTFEPVRVHLLPMERLTSHSKQDLAEAHQ